MSKKNTSLKLELPIYDMKSQLDYISTICKEYEFDCDKMVSFILADFILLVQQGLVKGMNMDTIFISYLKHQVKQRKTFDKYKEILENGK